MKDNMSSPLSNAHAGIWKVMNYLGKMPATEQASAEHRSNGSPHKAGMTGCFLFALLSLAVFIPASPAHAQDITTGLVGHWTLNETSGTTAADAAGSNDGTLTSMDGDEWTPGILDGALSFNGTTDYVTTSSLNVLDSYNVGTISAWIKIDGTLPLSGDKTFVAYSATSSLEGVIQWTVDDITGGLTQGWKIGGGGGAWAWIKGSTDVTDGLWHHVAFVADGTSRIKIYLDGIEETTTYSEDHVNGQESDFISDIGSISTLNQAIRIGAVVRTSIANRFDGQIDDIRIYNRALTVPDVAALYAAAVPQDITTGLVGHWKLDEGSGSTTADSAGTNNGTLNGMEAEDWINGALGQAVKFDDSSEYLNAGDADIIGGATQASICTWLYYLPASVTGDGSIISKYGSDGWMLFVDDVAWHSGNQNTISFTPDDGTTQVEGSQDLVTPGQWDHYCVTFSGGNYIKLYKNGILDTTHTTGVPAAIHDNNLDLRMGITSTGARALNGQIDDVRIYDRALTAPEIAALYTYSGDGTCTNPNGLAGEITFNEESSSLQYCNGFGWMNVGPSTDLADGLVAHWKLDDTTGNTITDSIGGNNGTWSDNDNNDVTEETITGAIGNAINFDGTDDTIYMGNADAGENLSNLSYALWIYPRGVGRYDVFQARVNNNQLLFTFRYNDNTTVNAIVYGTSGTSAIQVGKSNFNLNQWNSVVLTYNGTARLYINGSLVDTGNALNEATRTGPNDSMSISSSSFPFDGYVDDVRIYNRVLSTAEVKAYDAKGPSCFEPDTTSLVGHWALDETSGAVIADSSGNGNTGTWIDNDDNDVSGETVAGKLGTGLTFDATDDFINAGSGVTIDDIWASGGAASAWIYPVTEGEGGYGRIMSKGNASAWPYWHWHMDGNRGSAMSFSVACGGGYTWWRTNNNTVPLNQWSHVAIVYDSDDNSNTPTFYVNGLPVAFTTTGSCTNPIDSDTGIDLTIGNEINQNRTFDGAIDDARIYNRALTPVEIASLYGSAGGTCSLHACNNPFGMQGEIVFNTDFSVMQYCNGGNWVAMGPPSDGGAPCTNPAGLAGTLRYDADNNVLMYCEGDAWIAVAGH
jgi:hypothetical protein